MSNKPQWKIAEDRYLDENVPIPRRFILELLDELERDFYYSEAANNLRSLIGE